MSKERIKDLLAQLREEIRSTDVDDELQDLIGELDHDIQGVIENDTDVNDLANYVENFFEELN